MTTTPRLQTRIQPPQGIRRPLGGAEAGALPLGPQSVQSPPIASPPPRTTAAATTPPVQAVMAPTSKPGKVDILAGLTTEVIGRACQRYAAGDDVDSIMRDGALTADQLDALTKKYPGLPKQRELALLARRPVQAVARGPQGMPAAQAQPSVPSVRPAAIAAPAPAPQRKKLEPEDASATANNVPQLPAAVLVAVENLLWQRKPGDEIRQAHAEHAALLNDITLNAISQGLAEKLKRTEEDVRGSDEELQAQVRSHIASGWDSSAVAEKFGVAVEWVDELVAPKDESDAPSAAIAEAPAELEAATEAPAQPRYLSLPQSTIDTAWKMLSSGLPGSDPATVARTLHVDLGAVEDLHAELEASKLSEAEHARLALEASSTLDEYRAALAGVPKVVETVAAESSETEVRDSEAEAPTPREPRRLVKADRPLIAARLEQSMSVADIALELNLREDAVERVRRELEAAGSAVATAKQVLSDAAGASEVAQVPEALEVIDAVVGGMAAAFCTSKGSVPAPVEPDVAVEPPAEPELEELSVAPEPAAALQAKPSAVQASPQQIGLVFTALGAAFLDTDPGALSHAIRLVAQLEAETGLSAAEIHALMRWASVGEPA